MSLERTGLCYSKRSSQFCFPIQTFPLIPGLLQLVTTYNKFYSFNLEFRAALLGLRQGGVLKAIKHGNWCEFFQKVLSCSVNVPVPASKQTYLVKRARQLQNVNSEQDAIDSRLSDRLSKSQQSFAGWNVPIVWPSLINNPYTDIHLQSQLVQFTTIGWHANSKLFNIFQNHRVSSLVLSRMPHGVTSVSSSSGTRDSSPRSPWSAWFQALIGADYVLIVCWLVDCKPKNLEFSISAHRWRMDNSKWNYMYQNGILQINNLGLEATNLGHQKTPAWLQ